MKEIDKNKRLVVKNQAIVNFTKFQIAITDKLVKKEATEWLLEAQHLIDKKAYPAAIDACMKSLEIQPNNAKAYRLSGIARMLIGDTADALEDFSEAISRNPEDTETYLERGYLYFDLAEHMKAILDFSRVIDRQPTIAEAWYSRGIAQYEEKAYKAAIVDFSEAIALKPDYVEAWYNRGYAKFDLADYRGAIADFTETIKRCLLYTSPSPRDRTRSRMPSSA